jgi:hypothetical protein
MNKPNFTQGNYRVNMRIRKDQIGEFLNALHNMQEEMIEMALEKSDLQQAKDVIDYIKGKIK